MSERGPHRRGVRVVAVVDQRHAVGELDHLFAQRAEPDVEHAVLDRDPEDVADRQRGQRVLQLVRAGVGGLEPDLAVADPEAAGLLGLPEAADLDVGALQVRLEQRLLGNDRGAAGRERLDQLGLGAGDVLDRPDELEVDRRDVRDQSDLGPGERGEPRDLAEPAHAHLDDADLGVGLDPAQGERDAELVVEVPLRGDRSPVPRAERGQDVLGRGLAGCAGDRRRSGPSCGRGRRRRSRRARRARPRERVPRPPRGRAHARRSPRRRRPPRTGRLPRSCASRSAGR